MSDQLITIRYVYAGKDRCIKFFLDGRRYVEVNIPARATYVHVYPHDAPVMIRDLDFWQDGELIENEPDKADEYRF